MRICITIRILANVGCVKVNNPKFKYPDTKAYQFVVDRLAERGVKQIDLVESPAVYGYLVRIVRNHGVVVDRKSVV